MRALGVATVLAALLAFPPIWSAVAFGDDRPGDTTIVDQTFIFSPGGGLRECIDVPTTELLTIIVSSPPGRTGESAALNFGDNRQTVSPTVQLLIMNVPPDTVQSTHLAPPGSYCYYIAVTHNLTSLLPADAPEQPTKLVYLKIISTPYAS